ncbi:Autophagy-related protein 16-2 APG16-like 2 WD repeat-containing protein 80 [Channa argus]|uniref:Autophagy-related protein 16-2 APG16-like 2 WD repeat-containing protein 80 n=1 Tax=Channa argus TaxID=215402 RepID=A0A6G1PT16_CHAAH|nr:Autophagy-related protein 16-2 APG16-like 2 WD repeat-containing protein 80 [Channa argus]
MAAVTVTNGHTMTDSAGAAQRSGRVLAEGGSGGSAETWKRHIVRQLKNRDLSQHAMFQDLIRFYTQLLEKSNLAKGILSSSVRRPPADSSGLMSSLQLKKTTGELAYQVVELQQQIKIKECVLEEQHARLMEEECRLTGAFYARQEVREQVEQVKKKNGALKLEYDTLLEKQRVAETRLREAEDKGGHLLEDMIHLKQQAADRMNNLNERRSRARAMKLQKDLLSTARSKVTMDSSSSAPGSRSASPKNKVGEETTERRRTRLFRAQDPVIRLKVVKVYQGFLHFLRSASATSPRILTSIKELFDRKRRGRSVCSLEEDLMGPVGICLAARVPVRALQVLEAHEQGINAVRFSCSSDLLATGGTDRVIKLWEVRAGSMTHRTTLDGSTEGITCVEFDPTGSRVLAASYDKSALLWLLDDPVPKLTLTGHSRKVTAARFSSSFHRVVTGSADRTIRLWDLHRAACVQVAEVGSYCSDLVCSENCIISGHYDSKIRMWDTRTMNCLQEFPAQGKVTSLDISAEHRQLLSCCRDDCLQLVDLRRWSNERMCFRADGFKCGSDSTKAVISPDGCFLAAGSADGAVYIWNVSTGNLETRLPDKHSSSINAVSWSLSGEYVVSVDKSKWAILWSDI